jgi:hypothetical protein
MKSLGFSRYNYLTLQLMLGTMLYWSTQDMLCLLGKSGSRRSTDTIQGILD